MAGTDAERARRYRRHRRGDHSLCSPERCDRAEAPAATATVRSDGAESDSSPPPAPAVTERGPRGQELWDALAESVGPAQRVLLDEACRIADRLDRLDELLAGRETWASVVTEDGGEVRLVIDGLLGESRQQATALRGLLAEVVKAAPTKQGKSSGGKRGEVAGNVSSLAARAARRRATAG